MAHDEYKAELATIPEALEELRAGRMIVLADDPDRENEGDLVIAAERVTPEAITFMARQACGLICLPMDGELIDRLQLTPMAPRNTSRLGTAFMTGIEAREGVTTGISAADRAHTVRTAVADEAGPEDICAPGHVFPLRAKDGGVLVRTGQTEGSVDLARMAGFKPAAVICEIMNEDGTMARMPQLVEFCARHQIKMCTVADIVAYRHEQERLIELVTRARLPTIHGEFRVYLYRSRFEAAPHMALVYGLPGPDEDLTFAPIDRPVLTRVHSECLTGDAFGSLRCDCGAQLDSALRQIAEAGEGVLLYMRQEGRGIGLENKMRAYHLQDVEGLDTVEANQQLGFKADQRNYGVGAQILADLGVRQMRLLSNNPRKFTGLAGYGLEVVDRVPIEVVANDDNREYLRTKREKLGHLLQGV